LGGVHLLGDRRYYCCIRWRLGRRGSGGTGTGAAHALSAWALATLIVVAGAGVTAGSGASVASQLVGPSAVSMSRLNAVTREPRTTGQAPASDRQAETARKAIASGCWEFHRAAYRGRGGVLWWHAWA